MNKIYLVILALLLQSLHFNIFKKERGTYSLLSSYFFVDAFLFRTENVFKTFIIWNLVDFFISHAV